MSGRVRWRLKTHSVAIQLDVPLLTSRGSNGREVAAAAAEIKASSGTEVSLENQVICSFKLQKALDWVTMGLCSVIDFQTSLLKHCVKNALHAQCVSH